MNKKKDEWFSYLNSISSKLKLNLLVMILALLIYILWYSCNIGDYFSFKYLHISLGHIGYLGLLFIPAFCVIDKEILQRLWIFFSSLTLLDLQNMMYITNNQSFKNENIFFNSITLTMLIFLFLIVTIYGVSKSISSKNFITKWKDLIIVTSSSLLFIFIYHGINIINREIPNKERSCYIGTLECHHINYGILLLIFVPFLFKYISIPRYIYMFYFIYFCPIFFCFCVIKLLSFWFINSFI